MTNTDQVFFEEYKKIDKICCEMFGVPSNGVTAYITAMEETSYYGRCSVSDFEDSYYKLKELRHKRNILAHETGANDIAEDEDVLAVNVFYEQILSGDDPLHKAEERNRQKLQTQRKKDEVTPKKTSISAPSDIKTAYNVSDPKIRRSEMKTLFLCLMIMFIIFIFIVVIGVILFSLT